MQKRKRLTLADLELLKEQAATKKNDVPPPKAPATYPRKPRNLEAVLSEELQTWTGRRKNAARDARKAVENSGGKSLNQIVETFLGEPRGFLDGPRAGDPL